MEICDFHCGRRKLRIAENLTFSGRNPDCKYCFSSAFAAEKPNPTRRSSDLIELAILRYVI